MVPALKIKTTLPQCGTYRLEWWEGRAIDNVFKMGILSNHLKLH